MSSQPNLTLNRCGVLLLAGAVLATSTLAVTVVVRPDGTGDYATIQAAINALGDGDAIELTDGTFSGAGNAGIEYNGKQITIRSQSGSPEDCVISAAGVAGVYFTQNEGRFSQLEGVKITGGVHGIVCGQSGFPPITQDYYGSPTITNCIIDTNSAQNGGGIYIVEDSSPYVQQTTISNNTASGGLNSAFGGGVYSLESDPFFFQCTFSNNSVSGGVGGGGGGGLYAESSVVWVEECTFNDNDGRNSGGAVLANQSDVTLASCLLYGNVSGLHGGAVYAWGYLTDIDVDYCTFYANDAQLGSGFDMWDNASATINNTIIAFGVGGGEAVWVNTGGSATATCTDVYSNSGGDWVSGLSGQLALRNNMQADPLFCHPALNDFTLRDVSPCAPTGVPCGRIGAFGVGCSGAMTYLVCPTGSADFTTIQAAINTAQSGDTIRLCDATFTGAGNVDVDYGGKALTVESLSGNPAACIVDCAASSTNQHRGFVFQSGEDSTAILRGITIRNGYQDTMNDDEGGGILIQNGSSPTIDGCVVELCYAYAAGGIAVLDDDSDPRIIDCTLADNLAGASFGGGILLDHGTGATIHDCTFTDNHALDDGGGLATFNWVDLQRCTFLRNESQLGHGGGMTSMAYPDVPIYRELVFGENHANVGGGGMSIFGLPGGVIELCTFYENEATSGGGGGMLLANNTDAFLHQCTFHANASLDPTADGGGIAVTWSSTAHVDNTIVAYSTSGAGIACEPNDPSTAIVDCSDVYGNAGGDWVGCLFGQDANPNNISLKPQFCDPPSADFTLLASSPCAPYSPPNMNCAQIGAHPATCLYPVGDCNCDGLLNYGDIDPFVLALTNPTAYGQQYPTCNLILADCSGDDLVNYGDIDPFVAMLTGP